MQNGELNRKMSLPLALILMVLIATAGVVAFYLELSDKQKQLASAEQAMMNQQNHVMAVYDQIEANLASIREHESMISKGFNGPENSSNMMPEERIQNEINYVKYLIDENNKLIASLNDQINKKNGRIAGYEKTVKDFQTKVAKYQEQLDQLVAEKEALKNDLDNTMQAKNHLASQIDQFENEVVMKNGIIDQQNKQLLDKELALHTAYYKVGNYKTLRDQQILEKEGGVLGINRVTTLTENPDPDRFQKIDTREVTRIPIDARHWEIVTDQDPASYKLEYENNTAEYINITDPEKFWSKSQYLVIVVRDNDYNELASSR
jgi:hypothetical protein